jgi:hypothetical protein
MLDPDPDPINTHLKHWRKDLLCRERDEATPEDRRHVQEIKNFYYGAKTDLASLPGDEEAFLKLTGPSLQMPRFRISR